MNTFYHVTSKDPERMCHIIKPFTISKLNADVLSNGNVRSQEAINDLKKKIININNSRQGVLDICCKNNGDQPYNDNLLQAFRTLFPSVREVNKGGVINYLELSTTPILEKNKGWQQLKPYHICKLTTANIVPLNNNYGTTYKAINLTTDCYTSNCDNEDTLTLEGLLKEETNPVEYSYYDDLKMYQSLEDGNLDYIKTYLFKYNQINKVLTNDDLGNSILHIATKYYKKDIFDLIVALRPNVNVKNTYGDTPLHIACQHGKTEAINVLLTMNAEINSRNKDGMTPLMLAVQYHDTQPDKHNPMDDVRLSKLAIMIKTLLRKGADINQVNNEGHTVLHVFIKKGHTNTHFSSIVKMLLDNGVDVDIVDNKGKTALETTGDELKHVNMTDKHRNARKFLEQEGFEVNEVTDEDLTPRELELREVQTMLFNQVLKSNSDKYSDYINVKDIPKGAPIEVLNYVCSGDNPDIHGIENKQDCERLGGIFTKVKKPTTKVKLELLPESDKLIIAEKQVDLYYPKFPESVDKKELPDKIRQINMKPTRLNNVNSNQTTNLKHVDDEVYVDRDNMLPENAVNTASNSFKDLGGDMSVISRTSNKSKSITNVRKDKKSKELFDKLIKEPVEPPTFYSSDVLTQSVKDAYTNSNNYMITTKSNISKSEFTKQLTTFFKKYYLGLVLITILVVFLLVIVYNL